VTGKGYLQVNQDSVSCGSIGAKIIGEERTTIEHRSFLETVNNRVPETTSDHSFSHYMERLSRNYSQ
jgi:hypothetical protein